VGDINAAIATNEPGQQVSTSSVRTRNRIVQRNGKTWTQTEFETPNEKEVNP